MGRLENKQGDCKRVKHNPSFGQNTGIQKTLVETYKDNTKKIYRTKGRRSKGRPLMGLLDV